MTPRELDALMAVDRMPSGNPMVGDYGHPAPGTPVGMGSENAR